MVEIILQLLVCIVDAELLKAVGLKVLKAKNVQNTDGQTLENRTMNTNEAQEGECIPKITISTAFNNVDFFCHIKMKSFRFDWSCV